jgi:hypothetical protein
MLDVYLFGSNHRWWTIHGYLAMINCIRPFMFNHVIDVSWITPTLCFIYWIIQWSHSNLTCLLGWTMMGDGHHCKGNEYWVDYIKQWSMFYSHLSYAIDVCHSDNSYDFGHGALKRALPNSMSSQWSIQEVTTNSAYEWLWGMETHPRPIGWLPNSASPFMTLTEVHKFSWLMLWTGIPWFEWCQKLLCKCDIQYQRWKWWLRWVIYAWNVGILMVWVLLGGINPG